MLAPLAIVLVNNLKNTHNKQFNSDSQRLALSLRVELSVYGAVFKFSVCAAHTLIGRYATRLNFNITSISFSLAIRFLVSANQHCRLKSLNHSNHKTCKSS